MVVIGERELLHMSMPIIHPMQDLTRYNELVVDSSQVVVFVLIHGF